MVLSETNDRRRSAAAAPAVSSSHSRHGSECNSRAAARTEWVAPQAARRPHRIERPQHHPGSADVVRSDDGGDFSSDDDDASGEDDVSDIQGLFSLARLPYCRATKTFGGGSVGAATTTTTLTTTTMPSNEAQRLPAPQLPPSGMSSTKGAEAAAPRKHALVKSPVAVRRTHRRAFRPLPLSLHANQRNGIVRSHQKEGRLSTEKEEEEDDSSSSSDGGSDDSVVAAPLPPGAVEEAVVAAPVVGAGDAAAAEGPPRRRSRRCNLDENREFIKANFDPVDAASTEGAAVSSHVCRVCSTQVSSPKKYTVKMLLQHSMTRACLLRRAELLQGSQDATAEAVVFASASGPVVADAVWEYLGRKYDDVEPTTTAAGAAAPANRIARTAAAVTTTTKCRHCSMVVSKRDSQGLLIHLSRCVGITAVVQDAAETFHQYLLSNNCPPLPSLKLSDVVNALPPQLPPSFPTEMEEQDEKDDDSSSGVAVTVPSTAEAGVAAGVVAVAAVGGTAAAEGLPRRGQRCNRDENWKFVKANFTPPAVRTEGAAPSHTCRVCSQRVPCRMKETIKVLLRHSMSRSCLLRRAGLLQGSHGGAQATASASGSVVTDAVWEYLGRNYEDEEPPTTAAGAAEPANRRVQAAAAVTTTTTNTTCRHCSTVFSKRDSQALFIHLSRCVGITAVVQDATETLHQYLLSNRPPSSSKKSRDVIKAPPRQPPPQSLSHVSYNRETPSSLTEIGIHEQNVSVIRDLEKFLITTGQRLVGSRHPLYRPSVVDGANVESFRANHGLADQGRNDGSSNNRPSKSPYRTSDKESVGDAALEADCFGNEDEVARDKASSNSDLERSPKELAHTVERRAPLDIIIENEHFVAVNFGPPTESSSLRYCRCRICDLEVFRRIDFLLKHATTLACLVRRLDRRLLPYHGDSSNLGDNQLVSDALLRHRTQHFSPPTSRAAGFADVWTCRHCDAGIIGKNAERCFFHAAGCMGIKAALQTLEGILQATHGSLRLVRPSFSPPQLSEE